LPSSTPLSATVTVLEGLPLEEPTASTALTALFDAAYQNPSGDTGFMPSTGGTLRSMGACPSTEAISPPAAAQAAAQAVPSRRPPLAPTPQTASPNLDDGTIDPRKGDPFGKSSPEPEQQGTTLETVAEEEKGVCRSCGLDAHTLFQRVAKMPPQPPAQANSDVDDLLAELDGLGHGQSTGTLD